MPLRGRGCSLRNRFDELPAASRGEPLVEKLLAGQLADAVGTAHPASDPKGGPMPALARLIALLALAFASASSYAAGSLGPWTFQTNMTTAHQGHGVAASGEYVYAIGGVGYPLCCPYAQAFTSVEFAHIDQNGMLGSWNTTTPLLTGRHLVATVGAPGDFPKTYSPLSARDSGSEVFGERIRSAALGWE